MAKKSKNNNIKLYIITLLIMKVLIYFINWYFYAFTYKYNLYIQIIFTVSIVTFIFGHKHKSDKPSRINLMIIIFTILVFYFTKPNLTYNDGQKKIMSKNYLNVEPLGKRSIHYFDFKREDVSKVPNAYIYLISNKKEKRYVLISPYTGEVSQEKFGENSYIDNYLDD